MHAMVEIAAGPVLQIDYRKSIMSIVVWAADKTGIAWPVPTNLLNRPVKVPALPRSKARQRRPGGPKGEEAGDGVTRCAVAWAEVFPGPRADDVALDDVDVAPDT